MSSVAFGAGDRQAALTAPERWAREAVLSKLKGIREGTIEIREASGTIVLGGGARRDLRATVTVRDSRFWLSTLLGGSVGSGEAYMDGWWDCDDLVALTRILCLDWKNVLALDRGMARVKGIANAIWLRTRRNDRGGSRRNIAEHYDLGNDFFRLFLDPTMTYSCGIFEREESTLEEASIAKLDAVCRKLELSSADHVVEIGTGWGGFALHAAGRFGARVTTTTISKRQYDLAKERIAAAGLADRVSVILADYRDLTGTYDKLVSIEMIEAVGHEFLPAYFATVGRLLKPDGLALIQAITIADGEYDRARREVDFIKKHIFPGACIPSPTAMLGAATRASDLRLIDLEDITPHYATTLRHWRLRMMERREQVRALGYPESLLRGFEFYFATCEAGFAERSIGDVQMLFARPRSRRPPLGARG